MKKFRRIASMAAALAVSAGLLPSALPAVNSVSAAYGSGGTGKNIVEYLDRGITAINTGNGMLVSWRFLASDSDNAEFRLYRDNNLIYTSKSGNATCYLDKSGSSSSAYRVDYVSGGAVVSSENCDFTANKNYFDIPLKVPTGSGCTYSANDCSLGDVDGDGQYELFVKWDPSNSKDNSQEGYTGNVFIDCYTLKGKQLWRVDLGKNIRAGAHYTQFLVADFDCDGKAEMTCKTADGTVDGTGKVIGDASKDYRNEKGYILSGPEYYTLFEGATGKALDTVEYAFPRGKVSSWGDNYGNRVDRFLGAVVYCDGVKPSAVSVRGYYTRMTAVAYDVVDKKLVVRWKFDTGNSESAPGYHDGNHNAMPADVDNDGRQELVLGSTCIDDNGKLLWCNDKGHGDALHLSDFLPDREGLELWMCHENAPYGVSLIDAKTGKFIFHKDHSKDTGRACCGNILASNPGTEFWGATGGDIFNSSGKTIATNKPAQNMMIYWDGDLEREILDGTKISKYISSSKINTLLSADGCASNNSSKSSPCLSADVFGDWREELLLRSSDSKYIRVYSTPYTTDTRLTTLMHDVHYRTQVAAEQSGYNQPPHTSFYLGSDENLPERPNVTINGKGTGSGTTQPSQPTQPDTPAVTPVNLKFDLGANAQNGYTSVSASDVYSASKGYGFSSASGVSNVAASGSGALSDAVQFTSSTTFNADLPNGLYSVKVTLGNTSRTSVYMENMLQIVNMTGNNAVDEILIPVTDGQLNIRAAAGKAGYAYTISAIEINKVSDTAQLPKTVWLCGDSTVCNYYPKATSTQAGWGQVLDQYIDDSWNVRNMAASGQYAKGFVDAGQFDAIEHYGKKGDLYIISIGINDTNYSNATEYYNTVTDMVKRAKAKGMEVVLVKQQGRKGDYTKNPLLTSRWFAAQLDQIGKEQNVKVVDLFNLFQNYCVSIGATAADALFIDNLHPNRQGALKLAELFAKQIDWSSISGSESGTPVTPPQSGSELQDGAVYMIKNVNSGLYMEVFEETAANSTNVQQWTANGAKNHNSWKAVSAGNGYYYLISQLGDSNTYALDVSAKSTENGANIEIYTNKGGDNQQFKFVKNSDGSYTILTKITGDASCIEVNAKSTEAGANIQQWAANGGNNQKWILEPVSGYSQPTTTPQTTPAPVTTTTTTTVTAPPAQGVIDGDVNLDGEISVADAAKLKGFLIGAEKLSDQQRSAADINNDGSVNSFDMIMLRKLLNSFSSRYFAVDAVYVNAAEETVNEGFSGKGYINLDNSTDSSITWTLNAESAGNYLVTFRVANGTETDRPMKLEVNNRTDYWVQPFLGTGAWTQWAERGIVVPLNAGANTIKLTSLTENGGPNFDYVTIEKTDEPIAEVYSPEQDNPSSSVDPNAARTVYIAGDSTVQTYKDSYAPQQGWGAFLGDYLADNVTVSNHAIAGRSSKSFYDNGRLDTILASIKEGDQLLIQFGINDSASSKAERYAPVCGNVDSPTEGSFEFYLTKYIEGAKSKGAEPVLVTTVIGLKSYSNGKFVNSYTNYCQAMKKLAAKYNIPCIDLNSLMVAHYNSIGYDAAYQYHMCSTGSTDMTHFTETGAKAVAKLVADEMKKQGLC